MFHRRRQRRVMDNHVVSARSRNKLWFVFFVLFVFWYLVLYTFDWSPLPGLSSISHNQKNPINSTINSSLDHEINTTLTSNDDNANASNLVPTNATVDDVTDSFNHSSSENDTIEDLEGLQKELEPLLSNEDEDQHTKENRQVVKPCTNRYIYVHDLPSRFNDDLLKQCKLLNKWHDMCQYFENVGLGQGLGNPQRMLLSSGWYGTHQFSLEVIFHQRMKQYDCLTNDSSLASAIYVPYYAGLDVARYLWDSYNTSVKDADTLYLFEWLKKRPEWDLMGGKDHFLVTGRITWDFRRATDEDSGWGSKLMLLPESQNLTMLTIESSPWNKNDFAIPYPTYFHPSSSDQVHQWQSKMRRQKRKSLFCFAGAPRPDMKDSIRNEIMDQCKNSGRKCRMMECKDNKLNCMKPMNLMKMFMNSIFCLQPPGDSFTRRSTFDSILAGCIPVFFSPGSAYVQYLWHLPKDYESYSVLIPEDDVKNKKVSIEKELSRITRSKVLAMRDAVINLIPKVTYADPRSRLEGIDDAFDLTITGVLQRIEALRKEMREGTSSNDEFDEESSWKYYAFGTTKPHEWDHYFNRTNKWIQM